MDKETLDIFGQLLSGDKNVIIGKSRQSGKNDFLMYWRHSYDKYERALRRKESIKRIFNI